MEACLGKHTEAVFTRGIYPNCLKVAANGLRHVGTKVDAHGRTEAV